MRKEPWLRQLHVLYAVTALMDLSIAATMFAIGRRAAELDATPLELGLLGCAWFGVYAVWAPFAGRLSDRFGRRGFAVVGAALSAAVVFLCSLTANIPILLLVSVALGLGVGAFWPAIIAWVGEGLSGSALSLRMSRFSIAWNVGLFTGFGLSGLLFELDPALSFHLAAGGISAVVCLLLLPARGGVAAAAGLPELPRPPKGRGFRKTAWLSNFSTLFATSGAMALFPLLAIHLGIPAGLHGSLLVINRVPALLITILWPFVGFWQTRIWPVLAAQAVCAVCVAWIGFGTAYWQFALALAVSGISLGFNYQASIFFTLEEMKGKGEGGGIHEAMLGAGAFLGPLLAGWVGDIFSRGEGALRAPYFFCAAVLALFIAIEGAVIAFQRRRTSRAES